MTLLNALRRVLVQGRLEELYRLTPETAKHFASHAAFASGISMVVAFAGRTRLIPSWAATL